MQYAPGGGGGGGVLPYICYIGMCPPSGKVFLLHFGLFLMHFAQFGL